MADVSDMDTLTNDIGQRRLHLSTDARGNMRATVRSGRRKLRPHLRSQRRLRGRHTESKAACRHGGLCRLWMPGEA